MGSKECSQEEGKLSLPGVSVESIENGGRNEYSHLQVFCRVEDETGELKLVDWWIKRQMKITYLQVLL